MQERTKVKVALRATGKDFMVICNNLQELQRVFNWTDWVGQRRCFTEDQVVAWETYPVAISVTEDRCSWTGSMDRAVDYLTQEEFFRDVRGKSINFTN